MLSTLEFSWLLIVEFKCLYFDIAFYNHQNVYDHDDNLVENEYESCDCVSGTGVIPIIEVKDKGETKQIKAEEILSMVLFITGPWLKKVLQRKKLIVIRILDHRHKSLISKLLPTMILYIFFFL